MGIESQQIYGPKIDEIISKQKKRMCDYYVTAFGKERDKAEKYGDKESATVWGILNSLTSCMLNPDSKTEVFTPLWIFNDGRRSPIPSDFSIDEFNVLLALYKEVSDCELRARIGDVLWCEKRDYRAGISACDDYLKSAENLLESGDWWEAFGRIKRAVHLGVHLGRNNKAKKKIKSYIENKLNDFVADDCGFFILDLVELCANFGIGYDNKLIEIADKCCQISRKDKGHMLERCLMLLASLYQKAGDMGSCRSLKVERAEIYIEMANTAASNEKPSHLLATSYMQTAIKILRDAGGQKERVEHLIDKLNMFQEKMLEEMSSFSHEVDITETVKDVESRVTGLSKEDAFIAMVAIPRFPKIDDLRKEATENAEKYPLQNLFTKYRVREQGKLSSIGANAYSEDCDEREQAIFEQTLELANIHFPFICRCLIQPVRERINIEHNYTLDDFRYIASKSPFVPSGHEELFATGLFYGMRGDFLVASHLLAPQMENAIRIILGEEGARVTGFDANSIQKERSLNALLCEDDGFNISQKIFGEHIHFSLRWLLVEQIGPNLRNRIAHGMINDGQCFSDNVCLLWWICLYLCVFPIMRYLKNDFTFSPAPNNTPPNPA